MLMKRRLSSLAKPTALRKATPPMQVATRFLKALLSRLMERNFSSYGTERTQKKKMRHSEHGTEANSKTIECGWVENTEGTQQWID